MLRILTFLGEREAVGARSDVCLEKLLWILGVQEWLDEHSRSLQGGGESKNPDAGDVDERKDMERKVLRDSRVQGYGE